MLHYNIWNRATTPPGPGGGVCVAMKSLRSKAKGLSLLALFALAMQFALSFGHIHADAFAAPVAISDYASTPTSDSEHQQNDPADLCAICATVAMANALVDASPPLLPVPFDSNAVAISTDPASHLTATRLAAFQSRAPPQS
jgi:hypothetical protein